MKLLACKGRNNGNQINYMEDKSPEESEHIISRRDSGGKKCYICYLESLSISKSPGEHGRRFHPERGWYMSSKPKMGEWERGRAWDWTEALTLKQMASKGTQDCTQV